MTNDEYRQHEHRFHAHHKRKDEYLIKFAWTPNPQPHHDGAWWSFALPDAERLREHGARAPSHAGS